MSQMLFASPMFMAFLLASLALAITPGPGVLYVVARTAAQGRRAGLACVGGVALGNLSNAIGAALGLAALLAASSVAFNVVRFAGAAYLVFLGIQALRCVGDAAAPARFDDPAFGRIFREGFAVALLNPKTTLFVTAFLPQFMNPAVPAALQGAVLGTVFVLIAATTDSAYVVAAHAAASKLEGRPRWREFGRYATAAIYVGLGLFTAVSGSRSAR